MMDELIDELKQLVKEWEVEERRLDMLKEKTGDYFDGCSNTFGGCADQLKTIIEAHNES